LAAGAGLPPGELKVRDPLLIDEPRIPEEWRRNYLVRSPEKLAGDVTRLYDENWLLKRENGRMQQALLDTERRLNSAGLKMWIMGLVLGAQGSVIGWLVKAFLERMGR
jgi:hypothetical protein